MKIKKLISTILCGAILTTAIFSITANAEEVDHSYGTSGGVNYEGALFVEGDYQVMATTYRPNIAYCYAHLYIEYKTGSDYNPVNRRFEISADGPGYSKSAVINDNTAPGSIGTFYYAKGTHSLGGGNYIYTACGIPVL